MIDEGHGTEQPEVSKTFLYSDQLMQRTYLWVTVLTGWIGVSAGFLLLYTVIIFAPDLGLELNLTTLLSLSLASSLLFYTGFVIAGAVTSAVLVKFKLISLSEAFRYSFFSKRPSFWLRNETEVSIS